jgi:hypothetical protein
MESPAWLRSGMMRELGMSEKYPNTASELLNNGGCDASHSPPFEPPGGAKVEMARYWDAKSKRQHEVAALELGLAAEHGKLLGKNESLNWVV